MSDAENTIFRKPTDTDRQFFEVDLNKPKKAKKTAKEIFEQELGNQELIATKAGLPFARHAARDEFDVEIKKQINQQLREYGNIEYPERIVIPLIDWSKYSDLNNFELVEEGETFDEAASKANPGLRVSNLKKKYKYKGYGNLYTVMESGADAIKRAQERSWKARQDFEKQAEEPKPTTENIQPKEQSTTQSK